MISNTEKGIQWGGKRIGPAISLWVFITPPFLRAKPDPDAQQIFELTNQARLDHGLLPLKWSDSLATAADVPPDASRKNRIRLTDMPANPTSPDAQPGQVCIFRRSQKTWPWVITP